MLIDSFAKKLIAIGYEKATSLSIGGVVVDYRFANSSEDFATVYRVADEMLYEAKNSGKATYRLW